MRLLLVRHGESIGNSENRLQGQADYPLTPLGDRQAAATAERLAVEGTARVYSSHLLRAAATARTLAVRLGQEAVLVPAVAEYHFGDVSGATYAEIRERFAADPRTANLRPQDRVYRGEEGRDNFYRRVTTALWSICARHPGETVAVVSHGGPIALFCQAVLGLPYRRPMPFAIDNCSLNAIEVEPAAATANGHRAVLLYLNDCCHLKGLR